jgi:pyrimidine oxygenase
MVAKSCAAISDISGGRFDLNLVTGWNKSQYAQMGLWPGDQYYGQRYDYAEEYAQILRELWETGYSSFKGQFYELDHCQLGAANPNVGLICAGQSPRGMEFTAKYGDYAYVLGATADAEGIARTIGAFQEHAAREERSIKALTVTVVILEETDEEAKAAERAYVENADVGAIAEMQRQAGLDVDQGGMSARIVDPENSTFQNIPRIAGSPETVARYFDELAEIDSLEGVMMIFAEPLKGLDLCGREVIPRMESIVAPAPS